MKINDDNFKQLVAYIEATYQPNPAIQNESMKIAYLYDIHGEKYSIKDIIQFHNQVQDDDYVFRLWKAEEYFNENGHINPVIASYYSSLPKKIDVELEFTLCSSIQRNEEKELSRQKFNKEKEEKK